MDTSLIRTHFLGPVVLVLVSTIERFHCACVCTFLLRASRRSSLSCSACIVLSSSSRCLTALSISQTCRNCTLCNHQPKNLPSIIFLKHKPAFVVGSLSLVTNLSHFSQLLFLLQTKLSVPRKLRMILCQLQTVNIMQAVLLSAPPSLPPSLPPPPNYDITVENFGTKSSLRI